MAGGATLRMGEARAIFWPERCGQPAGRRMRAADSGPERVRGSAKSGKISRGNERFSEERSE